MAIQWGGTAGRMRVGIDVWTDGYDTNTPSINVYIDYYVQSDAWGFNDSQVLTAYGSAGGEWAFQMTSPSGATTTHHIGRLVIGGQGQNYNGGPYYAFGASISGHFQGATPGVEVGFNLPARPPNVPANPPMGIDSVTSNSARVVVYPADPRGSGVTAYQVLVGTNVNDVINSQIANFGGGTGTVSGLAPATSYYAIGRAFNAVGVSGWTGPLGFTTGATTPGTPTALAASGTGQTNTNLTWSAPNNGGSAINTYNIQIATDAGFTQNLWNLNDPTSPADIQTLTPGVTYYARVRAVNGVGPGPWTAAISFVTLAGTPTIVSPVMNQVKTDARNAVIVQALGVTAGRTITVEVSQNSSFASGVSTLTLSPSAPSADNRYGLEIASSYLVTGVWYARAKVTNTQSGYVTPWSSTVTFSQAHTPAVNLVSPTAAASLQYTPNVTFQWQFVDPAHPKDLQKNYQLIIENNTTNAVIFDSGKVALATTANNTNSSRAVALASNLKNVVLRWKVRVWDQGDTPSAYSGYSLFTLADPPVITIMTPSSGMSVDNGSPRFSWTVAIPSGGSIKKSTVRVFDQATNTLVWETTVDGAFTEVTPPVVILANAKSYYFTVKVEDTLGLSTQQQGSFTTSYQAPPSIPFSIDGAASDIAGYNQVSWSEANPDALFVEWKIYRRSLSSPTWELITTIPDQNVRLYRDFLINAGETYSYSVTQSATRSGVILESPVGYRLVGTTETLENRQLYANLTKYWLIAPDRPELSTELTGVTSDPVSLQYESATYTIVGRGRHRDYGDRLGYTGTLTCQVHSVTRPSAFRLKIEALREAQETYWLRTPFGRLFKVALGDIDWTPRAGVGIAEMGELSIPYEEVA